MNRSVTFYTLRFVSSLHTLLSSIDFLLSNVRVAVVGPDGVGSELTPLSVSPSLVGDVSYSSSSVVGWNFHDSAVLFVGVGFQFFFEYLIIFHFVKGPGRTDGQNVVAFFLALCLVVIIGD